MSRREAGHSPLAFEPEEAGAKINVAGFSGDQIDGVEGVEFAAAAEEDAGLAQDVEVLRRSWRRIVSAMPLLNPEGVGWADAIRRHVSAQLRFR